MCIETHPDCFSPYEQRDCKSREPVLTIMCQCRHNCNILSHPGLGPLLNHSLLQCFSKYGSQAQARWVMIWALPPCKVWESLVTVFRHNAEPWSSHCPYVHLLFLSQQSTRYNGNITTAFSENVAQNTQELKYYNQLKTTFQSNNISWEGERSLATVIWTGQYFSPVTSSSIRTFCPVIIVSLSYSFHVMIITITRMTELLKMYRILPVGIGKYTIHYIDKIRFIPVQDAFKWD